MNTVQSPMFSRAVFSTGIILSSLTFSILVLTPIMDGEVFASDFSKGKDIVELNSITIDKAKKEVRIKAQLAIEEGILEYFLVGDQGKTYESVFKVIGNKPSELNFALLLIGCKPFEFERLMKLIQEKKASPKELKGHEQSLLEIEVYKDGKKFPFTRLVKDREGSGKPLIWIYTGGYFTPDNRYVGDMELSYIGFWPDPSTVINLFSTLGNPYQGNFGFEMNRDNKALKVDQDFELVIRRRQL